MVANTKDPITDYQKHKTNVLLICLGIDVLGMLSYFFPVIGEWTDILTAVLTALAIFRNFNSFGWAAFGFFEEILPFTDAIPSATLAWVYRYVIKGKQTKELFLNRNN